MSWGFAEAALLTEIVAVNLMLSGDNAIVVALAIRKLPPAQRKIASSVGIRVGVVAQILATLTVASLLQAPIVSCVGGGLLGWVGIRLLQDHRGDQSSFTDGRTSFLNAIMIVAAAYLLESLDNILAIAAIGQGHPVLLAVGLLLSCEFLVLGSLVVAELMRRYPLLVTLCAGVVGWIGGAMITAALSRWGAGFDGQLAQLSVPFLMTIVVVSSPFWWPARDRGNLPA